MKGLTGLRGIPSFLSALIRKKIEGIMYLNLCYLCSLFVCSPKDGDRGEKARDFCLGKKIKNLNWPSISKRKVWRWDDLKSVKSLCLQFVLFICLLSIMIIIVIVIDIIFGEFNFFV